LTGAKPFLSKKKTKTEGSCENRRRREGKKREGKEKASKPPGWAITNNELDEPGGESSKKKSPGEKGKPKFALDECDALENKWKSKNQVSGASRKKEVGNCPKNKEREGNNGEIQSTVISGSSGERWAQKNALSSGKKRTQQGKERKERGKKRNNIPLESRKTSTASTDLAAGKEILKRRELVTGGEIEVLSLGPKKTHSTPKNRTEGENSRNPLIQ